MAELTRKQLRRIDLTLNRLFAPPAFLIPRSIKDIPVTNILTRTLRLASNRTIYLTESGLASMRGIVDTLDEAELSDGLATYSDYWTACRRVLEDLLSKEMRPDGATELLALIHEKLNAEISNYTYAVPLFGVDLKDSDPLRLGSMTITRSPLSYITAAGVKHDHTDLPRTLEASGQYLWLLGSAMGTSTVAERKFREQAALAVGMLAVSAASMYERGASAFRMGVIMAPEDVQGRAIWLSWSDTDLELTTHYNVCSSQQFTLDSDLVNSLAAAGVFPRAFAIFETDNRTQLEDAITKAVYWFSDAHRDPVPVMQLIKYWSCVETFFSSDNEDITRSVCTGLASILVYGGYNFVPEKDYASFKKRATKLYSLRSRAVHGAAYHHVSGRDVAELSQWVAWMLVCLISFVKRGYTGLGEIKAEADRLSERGLAESK